MGVDPTTSAVTRQCSTVELQPQFAYPSKSFLKCRVRALRSSVSQRSEVVPVNGIGPLFKAYESFVLPLNYTGGIETLTKLEGFW